MNIKVCTPVLVVTQHKKYEPEIQCDMSPLMLKYY